jgi:hypothetical protein
MISLHAYLKGGLVFDHELTHVMGAAFDEVCRALAVAGHARDVREAIALKVIEIAGYGEHDPDRLRDAVLRAMGAPDRPTSSHRSSSHRSSSHRSVA